MYTRDPPLSGLIAVSVLRLSSSLRICAASALATAMEGICRMLGHVSCAGEHLLPQRSFEWTSAVDWIVSATRAIRGGPSNSQGLPAEYWSGQVHCSLSFISCVMSRRPRISAGPTSGRLPGSGQLANRRLAVSSFVDLISWLVK